MTQANIQIDQKLDRVLLLNQKAIDFASIDDWDAALACISKRHDGLVDLFKLNQEFLLSIHTQIISMTDQIEVADKTLRRLASTARVDLEGKIAHLSLRKKASTAYQAIASQ